MTPLTLYGIPNCDTVKKARAWLDREGIEYRFHDYKKQGVDRMLLQSWVLEHGWESVLNRAGMTFRKLDPKLTQEMDADKAVALMIDHPSSIKRPIAVAGKQAIVGFKADAYATAFSSRSRPAA